MKKLRLMPAFLLLGFLLNCLTGCKQPIPAKLADGDGNVYHTVVIGKQVWMAENLKVTHYRNGDIIPNVPGKIQWSNLTSGGYCNYDNNDSLASVYGHLYNWYAVTDNRNIAPEGWHVPTDEEFKTLQKYLKGDSISGAKLKETGTSHWISSNSDATEKTGFNALPAGYRNSFYGTYHLLGNANMMWTSTPKDTCAWMRTLSFDHKEIFRNYVFKSNGLTVRCIKD